MRSSALFLIVFFFLGLVLPNLSFAQNSIWDSKNKKTLAEDCDDRVFEKVETLPSVSISLDAYADSLSSFLKRRQINLKRKKAILSFIVTSHSEIFDLKFISPILDKEDDLEAAFLGFSNLWLPAKQNSHIVCSYVKLELSFTKDKLGIRIYQ